MKSVIFLVFFLAFPVTGFPATWYVDDDNIIGPWNGTKQYPFRYIQEGIDTAANGDTVHVFPGQYPENIDYLGKTITVESSDGPEVTTIDGSQAGTVVTMGSSLNAVLEGFTVTNGYAINGGGIITGINSTIKNNLVSGNQAAENGGGIHGYLSLGNISHNIIEENIAGGSGGGIHGVGDLGPIGGLIEGNILNENEAQSGGGIGLLYIDTGGDNPLDLTIRDNLILSNTVAFSGGGIFIDNLQDGWGSVLIDNNAIVLNAAQVGGGISYPYPDKVQTVLKNNTITENTALQSGGGISTGSTLVQPVVNTILWNNHAPAYPEIYGSPKISYSVVKGGWTGTGNKDEDPLFADAPKGDVHLFQDPCQPGVINPCTDAGNPSTSPINGTNRTDWVEDSGYADIGFHYPLDRVFWVPASYPTIQAAIDAASDWYTILVGAGTYKENIDFKGKAVTVQSVPGPWVTAIDGNQSGSVVTFTSGEGPKSVLKGFTITNGLANMGGGIACKNGSSPTIRQNIITGNSATQYKGGIGGGIYCADASSPLIVNCTIAGNMAAGGKMSAGAGIYCETSSCPTVMNSTITENTANTGGGIHSMSGSDVTVVNTILWNNAPTEISGSATVSNSDIMGGWPGTGNIDQDPLFADPVSKDFHLTWTSPCINRGKNVPPLSDDLDGHLRPFMGTVDMGADEFVDTHPLEADVFFLDSNAGGPVQFTLNAGPGNAGRYYAIFACVSGTTPGTWLPKNKTRLPLNFDGITNFVIANMNTWTFDRFLGNLDPLGQATATFNSTVFISGWYDITMSFAFTMNNPFDFASNPINVKIDN